MLHPSPSNRHRGSSGSRFLRPLISSTACLHAACYRRPSAAISAIGNGSAATLQSRVRSYGLRLGGPLKGRTSRPINAAASSSVSEGSGSSLLFGWKMPACVLKHADAAAIPAILAVSSDHHCAAPAFSSDTVSAEIASQSTVFADRTGASKTEQTARPWAK